MDGRHSAAGTAPTRRRTPPARRRDLRWVPVAIVVWTASLVAVPASVLAYQAAHGADATTETEVSPAAVRQDRTPAASPAGAPATDDATDPVDPTGGQDVSVEVAPTTVGDAAPSATDAPPAEPEDPVVDVPDAATTSPTPTPTATAAPSTAAASSSTTRASEEPAAVSTEQTSPSP